MTNTMTIDSKQFHTALGSFTTGVTVVTTRGVEHVRRRRGDR
jgi:flavin reductase (DIM6/NTAB) family NADH-FMN oxidoreductase RutF